LIDGLKMDLEHQLYYLLILIPALGLAAQWIAWKYKLPAIVLLSAFGLILGPGLDVVHPSTQMSGLVQTFIKFSVAVILFEGGLNLSLFELKETVKGIRRLVFPALFLAWGAYSLCAYYIGKLSLPISLTFGAIIVVSGPTVVMPMLRQARLKRRISSYIKWEGIINDPIGALLAVLVFQYFILSQFSGDNNLIWNFTQGIIIASVAGVGTAKILGFIFEKGWAPEYLTPAIVFVCILGLFYLPNLIQDEAGLLAVTLFGLTLSNLKIASMAQIHRFHETLTVILVSCLFIILTASIDINQIMSLDLNKILMIATIIFIARPIVIMISTVKSQMTIQERILLSWIAPRGVVAAAVAGVFAYELNHYGYSEGNILVPLVFSIILVTVVAHGFTISFFAKKLGLAATNNNGLLIVGASLWAVQLADFLSKQNVNVMIADASWHSLKYARLANIKTYHGQVLSEEAEEHLDLSEIGYVIAATNNDAYNAMICSRFGHELGRNKTYQLPILSTDQKDSRDLHPSLAGKQLFNQDYTYEELMRRHYMNWNFSGQKLSGTLDFGQYTQTLPKDTLPIAIIKKDGSLSFNIGDEFEPTEGETPIVYRPKAMQERRGAS
jgi:NhaP-type Na+/H+ or K+/H+ antiporter